MRYNLEDIEDQILATLSASSGLSGVVIKTHAGEVNMNLFLDPQYYEGVISLIPFVFIRYAGRVANAIDDLKTEWKHELKFQLYIATSSLRSRKESQRNAYALIRACYDALIGRWPNSTAQTLSGLSLLSGSQITTTNFSCYSPMNEDGGQDERLIIETPKLVLYSSMWTISVLA